MHLFTLLIAVFFYFPVSAPANAPSPISPDLVFKANVHTQIQSLKKQSIQYLLKGIQLSPQRRLSFEQLWNELEISMISFHSRRLQRNLGTRQNIFQIQREWIRHIKAVSKKWTFTRFVPWMQTHVEPSGLRKGLNFLWNQQISNIRSRFF